MSWAPPNRKSAFQGYLKSTCSGIWNTPPRIFNRRAPNPVNVISGHWGCQLAEGFLISRMVCPWRGDEVMARIERQEVSNKVYIHCLILITLQWFVRCMKPIASMWQLWVKVIAPPTGSRKCHFQNALNSASYFYPICFKLHQNNVKTRPM